MVVLVAEIFGEGGRGSGKGVYGDGGGWGVARIPFGGPPFTGVYPSTPE
jgi:hypothetical protein